MADETTLSRRSFLQQAGIVGAAVTTAPLVKSNASAAEAPEKFVPQGAVAFTLKINGRDYRLRLDPRTTLLDCLRETVDLTGTKKGCDHGQCGACTVHVNGQRINSCLSFAIQHVGDEITTIEGLGTAENLHPVQQAFCNHDGFQCGYCTPGQIMSAAALMKEPCGWSDAEVKDAMSGNICRCGAYKNILAAIKEVHGKTSGKSSSGKKA